MPPSALRHVEHFANSLGPRGSCTPQEKAAHDYCQATLEELGYPREQLRSAPEFRSLLQDPEYKKLVG